MNAACGARARRIRHNKNKVSFNTVMRKNNPVANPAVVLREEPDDWAILFDPEKNNIFTLDPVAVFIWKHLDGGHAEKDIVKKLKTNCSNAPADTDTCVKKFIQSLIERGMAGYHFVNKRVKKK